MKSPAGLGIGNEKIAFRIPLPSNFEVCIQGVREVIRINEVVAGVVGGIDEDYVDLAKIGLVEKLEDFEVVSFDKDIFRIAKVHGLGFCGYKSSTRWHLENLRGISFSRPRE